MGYSAKASAKAAVCFRRRRPARHRASPRLHHKLILTSQASIRLVHQDAVVNRLFSVFKCLIFDSSVDGGIPSFAAAPGGPATLPLLLASAPIMSFF